MQIIREQRDLALLPEPRFICMAPASVRWSAVGLIVICAFVGGCVSAYGIANGGDLLAVLGGGIVIAICLSVLILGRPIDWRVWVDLAATPEGLYLVARARRVVFVPWRDVIEIGLEKIPTRGGTKGFARLSLRLSVENWANFGNLSSIKGSGAIRQYWPSAAVLPGEMLVTQLKAFRNANG